jgi:hypothetical protein
MKAMDTVPKRYLAAWGQFQCQCPAGVTEQTWRQAIDDAGRFIAQWGKLADSFGWSPGDLFDVPRDGAMGLVWWLKGRLSGRSTRGVGQPAYDRVARREWVNPYARPGPASLPLADPGASAKDHAAGAWPMTFRKILSLTKTTLLRMFWMETPHPYSDAPAVMLYVN